MNLLYIYPAIPARLTPCAALTVDSFGESNRRMRQIFVQETPGGAAQGAASHESQGQVQQQLEERQGPRPETPGSHRQCPARLPAQGFRHDQPKPRARGRSEERRV